MSNFKAVSVFVMALSVGLTGCFRTTHLVQKVVTPPNIQTATVDELQTRLSARDNAIKTLNANVLITASVGGGKEGKVTEYTSFRGYIFVRKPSDLRVLMQLPVIGSRAVDMVSDGEHFTLLIPPKNRAIVGTNAVTKPSKNGLENLRPSVFFDSLLVPGVGPDDLVSLTENTRVVLPEKGRRDAIAEPDYDLTISRRKSGNVLQLMRVVHINRVTMLPFEQDLYDDQGRVVTVATYDEYQPYGDSQFPSLINIRRPLDEYALKVQVSKLTLNGQLDDDQFELKIPEGATVQHVE